MDFRIACPYKPYSSAVQEEEGYKFFKAAVTGEVNALKKLLDKNPELIHTRGVEQRNVLHFAHQSTINLLIERGISVGGELNGIFPISPLLTRIRQLDVIGVETILKTCSSKNKYMERLEVFFPRVLSSIIFDYSSGENLEDILHPKLWRWDDYPLTFAIRTYDKYKGFNGSEFENYENVRKCQAIIEFLLAQGAKLTKDELERLQKTTIKDPDILSMVDAALEKR